jgi:hypothetical protein
MYDDHIELYERCKNCKYLKCGATSLWTNPGERQARVHYFLTKSPTVVVSLLHHRQKSLLREWLSPNIPIRRCTSPTVSLIQNKTVFHPYLIRVSFSIIGDRMKSRAAEYKHPNGAPYSSLIPSSTDVA